MIPLGILLMPVNSEAPVRKDRGFSVLHSLIEYFMLQ